MDNIFIRLKNFFNKPKEINPFYYSYVNGNGSFTFDSFDDSKVIDKGYAYNPDLYSIVRKIASTGSAIPLKLYEIDKSGEWIEVEQGDLYNLIQQPNRMQYMNEFIEESLTYLLLSGNSYIAGFKSLGMGDVFRELNILHPNYIDIQSGGVTNPVEKYWYKDIYNLEFDANNVLHTKYINPKGDAVDRLYGLSPLQAGFIALQSSNNTYQAKGNIITNHGVSGIITSDSDRSLRPEEADEVQKAWDRKQNNPSKFGRTLTSTAKLRFIQMGLSSSDLQLLESGVFDMRSLCNVYSVPSQLFNDVAGTTFNNMAAAKKSLYTEAVIPNMKKLLQGLNGWFISSWSKYDNKQYCLEMDTSEIEVLQADQKLEAEKDKVVTETILNVLKEPISNESKIQLLIYGIGMTEQEAQLLVGNQNDSKQ